MKRVLHKPFSWHVSRKSLSVYPLTDNKPLLVGLQYVSAIILVLCAPLLSAQPESEQRLVYNNQPVAVTLSVGHEHRLRFPEPVHVDLPARLAQATATLQPDAHVVYITGQAELSAQRVIATATSGERVYLVDVQVVPDGPQLDYRIESPTLAAQQQQPTTSATSSPAGASTSTNPPQIELLRHASQSLYAPTRLRPTHRHIRRAPTPEYPAGVSLLRSRKGEAFDYQVVAAWRGFGRYLTAVEIINRTDVLVELDPRDVRGAFDAVAFQHPWVGRAGTLEDRTTMYLISDNPFPDSAQGVSYGR